MISFSFWTLFGLIESTLVPSSFGDDGLWMGFRKIIHSLEIAKKALLIATRFGAIAFLLLLLPNEIAHFQPLQSEQW